MASYQTGSSSSPTNLLQTLVTWLGGRGWTQDSSVAEGSGWRAHLHKNGLYVNFRAAMNEQIWPKPVSGYYDAGAGYGIGLYLGTGYNGANAWHLQPGVPLRSDGGSNGCGMNLPAGSTSGYFFFDDLADNIVIVVQRSPGIYCHMGFGPSMVDLGLPEAFPYFFGSSSGYRNVYGGLLTTDLHGINVSAFCPMAHGDDEAPPQQRVHATGFVKVDAATWTSRWVSNTNKVVAEYGYTGRHLRCALNDDPATLGGCNDGEYPGYRYLRGRVHQIAFAGALILPVHCYVWTDPGGRWAPVGYLPAVSWCEAVGHGYSPGGPYYVGGKNYMVFPGFAIYRSS